MGFISFVYIVTVLFTGVPAMFRDGFAIGLCGTLAPLLALVAGGGITTALRESDYPKGAGVVIGLVMLAASVWWVWYMDWSLQLFGLHIPGVVENIVGFGLGLLFGRKDR